MRFLFTLKAFALMATTLMCLPANAQLRLDVQPAGGTTAAGWQALEATNQVLAVPTQDYSAFGTTVSVDVTTANIPENLDFRAVARDGAADDKNNDWLGVDARGGLIDATLSVQFSGLPAGDYNWTSHHEDGGAGTTNGNINGQSDWTLAGGSGVLTMFRGDSNPPNIGQFSTTFSSDGINPVTFSMIFDEGQGASEGLGTATASNAIFAYVTGIEISQAIPEPTSFVLLGLACTGLTMTRRRK